MPLFWRIFLANAGAVLLFVLLLAFSSLTISSPPTVSELGTLGLGAVVLLLINAAILGTSLTPLIRLREKLTQVDGSGQGERVAADGAPEMAGVAAAYNDMLSRLEQERTRSVREVLRAQEQERARVARELHDEVGQTMTFLLLRLSMTSSKAPAELADDLQAVTAGVRTGLEQVRTMSRRLRPSGLADLGIGPALHTLIEDARRLVQIPIRLEVGRGLGRDEERDLVIYRVTQEALTNIVKHARANAVSIDLRRNEGHLELTITDDGVGIEGVEGTGTYSMRERARLVGGHFERISSPGQGTRVILQVPAELSGPQPGPEIVAFPTTTVFPPTAWESLDVPPRATAAPAADPASDRRGEGHR